MVLLPVPYFSIISEKKRSLAEPASFSSFSISLMIPVCLAGSDTLFEWKSLDINPFPVLGFRIESSRNLILEFEISIPK